jgi:hypothetical protein
MQKNILIIADSLENVKLKSDSSLFLAQVALEKGYNVSWCEPENVHIFGEKKQRSYEDFIEILGLNYLQK